MSTVNIKILDLASAGFFIALSSPSAHLSRSQPPISGFTLRRPRTRVICMPTVTDWKLTMLKQQEMTEVAKAVFDELSTEPATVGEVAQNTHLTRERCQLILTQLVMAGLSDYQIGCYMLPR